MECSKEDYMAWRALPTTKIFHEKLLQYKVQECKDDLANAAQNVVDGESALREIAKLAAIVELVDFILGGNDEDGYEIVDCFENITWNTRGVEDD